MKKIISAIKAYDMLTPGEQVIVGLSGGADSVLLTYALYQYGAKVTAVHVNHMLRGEESMRDEMFAKQFCAQYGIPCLVFREDITAQASKDKVSIETAGRDCRYRIFLSEAKKRGAKIATAHTLSDQAETMLFRLARGSGISGLCGILPVREREGCVLIRPLLELSRKEVERCLAAYGLSYVTDSSNLENDYVRNRIRHQVIPVLQEINAAAERHFGESAKSLSEDADYLNTQAQMAYHSCCREGKLSADALLSLHPAMQSRVLICYLEQYGIQTDRLMLQRIDALLQRQRLPQTDKRYGAVSLPGERDLLLRGGTLFIKDKQDAFCFPTDLQRALSEGKELRYEMPSGGCFIFSQSDTKPIQNVHKNLFFFCLDYDKIKGVLTCRGRMPGDRLCIAGRCVTKTLKKWMNETDVPITEREKRFVLADDEGVVFAEGLGCAQRVAVDESTRHFLTIKNTGCDRVE